jgi:hypothetical protein
MSLFIGGCADGRVIEVPSETRQYSVSPIVGQLMLTIRGVLGRTEIHEYRRRSLFFGCPDVFVLCGMSDKEIADSLLDNYRPDVVSKVEELEKALATANLRILNLTAKEAIERIERKG